MPSESECQSQTDRKIGWSKDTIIITNGMAIVWQSASLAAIGAFDGFPEVHYETKRWEALWSSPSNFVGCGFIRPCAGLVRNGLWVPFQIRRNTRCLFSSARSSRLFEPWASLKAYLFTRNWAISVLNCGQSQGTR